MPKILFPTDFSDYSMNAFQYALDLANKIGASITTIHVYEKPNIPGIEKVPITAAEIYEELEMESFEEFKSRVQELRKIQSIKKAEHLTIKHELVKSSNTIRAICRVAEKLESDFIVMGTKGASGLKEIFLGSFTGEIMENAPCPVLGIPIKASLNDKDVSKIALTYDFERDTPKLVETVLLIAEIFNSQIYCLHLDGSKMPDFAQKEAELKRMFNNNERVHYVLLDHSDLEKGLTEYTQSNAIDIITMISHKRNFFQELFHYSLTKKMAYHSQIPILALPAKVLASNA